MAWDSDEVIEYYRQNARKMDPIYAGRLTMGMRKEIPFVTVQNPLLTAGRSQRSQQKQLSKLHKR